MRTVQRGFPYADIVPVLLLTDGPLMPTPAVAALAQAYAAAGFTSYVVPWHAARIEPGRLLLAGGALVDLFGTRPLPLWTPIVPRAVVPVASTKIEGLAIVTRGIADSCPDAVFTWLPELIASTEHAGTKRLVRTHNCRAARATAGAPTLAQEFVPENGAGDVLLGRHHEPAGGGQRYVQGATALAVLNGRENGQVAGNVEVCVTRNLRVYALITGMAPVQVAVSGPTDAGPWTPSRTGPPAADDLLAEQVHALARDYVAELCAAARLADLPSRRRLLPWLMFDLVVTDDRTHTTVSVSDVDLFCEPPSEARIAVEAAKPLLAELYRRCRRPRAVLLPEPDTDLTEPSKSVHDVPFIATLLPQLGPAPCLVETVAWRGATFAFRDDRMRLPAGADTMNALGRVIGRGSGGDLQRRYVEPGVGRACLIDRVTVRGRPEFIDASVLGIGLTPYSERGYAMVGPHVDGLTSMLRAELRRVTAERLEQAGCRTSLTTAIIALPGLETTMPDYTTEPAALVVRAFRCVLRVKQLDPLATPYLSPQHRPLLWEFLADQRWEVDDRPSALGRTAGRLGGTVRSQRMISDSAADPHVSLEAARRREVIAMYAPLLVRFASRRLAIELGRDPDAEPVTTTEYVEWFASRVGAQLAIMGRERFLHDYHQPGVGRLDPNLAYSLGESNVSLLAEFVDFDTGIFCDEPDDHAQEALRLRRADLALLQTEYPQWHAHDTAEARSVVRTLSTLAGHGQRSLVDAAMRAFDRSYEIESATKETA